LQTATLNLGMDEISSSTYQCSVARTVEVVGERWTMLILREAFLGVKRFDHIQRDLGIARNILSDRLGKLVDQGILEKRRYSERPPRDEYRLTAKGRDLYPIVVTLMQWGDKYTAPDGAPVVLVHQDCGHITSPQLTCDGCGEPVHALNVRPQQGPGLRSHAA
jgi:DNA-binding HxlR family transcriptional regulator